MNGVEFLAYFINILMACTALPMTEQRIGAETYQVGHYVCQTSQGPMTVRTWRRPCDTGHAKYWGRQVFLEIDELHTELYVNKFGEVMIGQGARLEDAYQTACGS